FEDIAGATRNDTSKNEFGGVMLRGLLTPVEHELAQAVLEQRQDGEDGAGLDNDVKEVALAYAEPMLDDQQVARGRDGEEFGDSFDDTEEDDSQPVRHSR